MHRFFMLTPLLFCGCSLILSDNGVEIDAGGHDDLTFYPFGALKAFTTQDLPSSTITIDTSCMINTDQFEPVDCSPIERVMNDDAFVLIRTAQLTVPSGQTLRAVGSKPLVIIAKTISVAGTIDLGSRTAELLGGAGFRGCEALGRGGEPGSVNNGGGGGGFASPGGKGAGGTALGNSQPQPNTLLGGCPGGGPVEPGGLGGLGGGAIQLVATKKLTIGGTIKVGGAGGTGRPAGGGGSGGMIVLDAPSNGVHLDGAMFHYGGGGGAAGAGGDASGDPGESGREGGSSGGLGGKGTGDGGHGGNGSSSTSGAADGSTGSGTRGGGGGGGGSGFCLIHNLTTADGGGITTCVNPN